MSGINEPISIGTEEPEYYAELSARLPDPQIGAYRSMNNPVLTFPVFRALMARSPGAYRHFSMQSPISPSFNEETSPPRWPA